MPKPQQEKILYYMHQAIVLFLIAIVNKDVKLEYCDFNNKYNMCNEEFIGYTSDICNSSFVGNITNLSDILSIDSFRF